MAHFQRRMLIHSINISRDEKKNSVFFARRDCLLKNDNNQWMCGGPGPFEPRGWSGAIGLGLERLGWDREAAAKKARFML